MSHSFHPPVRTLMGPGPSDVNPRILEALSRPTIGHLDPAFVSLISEVKGLLQFAFQTGNELTMPVSAPGSAGMEACFVNLVSAGDKVIVAQNGVFGGRMKENVERCGAEAVMVQDDWGEKAQRAYHHTAPVNSIYALHEALIILREEGLENAWARHRWNHDALAAGITGLGLDFVVPADYRLPQLNAVAVPEGVDEASVRRMLLDEYQLEIGAGLGPLAGKVWRIGLMGYASSRKNVPLCLGALEAALGRSGGVSAARAAWGD